MIFFHKSRSQKVADNAFALCCAGQTEEAFQLLESSTKKLKALPWSMVAEKLLDAEMYAEVRRALEGLFAQEPEHWDGLVLLAELEFEDGHPDKAIEVYRTLHRLAPKHFGTQKALTYLLFQTEQYDEILSIVPENTEHSELALQRAKALIACEQEEEAMELLTGLMSYYKSRIKHAASPEEAMDISTEWEEVRIIHDELFSQLHGREALVVRHALEGQLDASEGVNYQLLGQSLMQDSPRIAPHLTLLSAAETAALGERLLEEDEFDSVGLCQMGIASMRWLALDDARQFFERACEADGRNFAAFLGLGSTMNCQKYHWLEQTYQLPETHLLPIDQKTLQAVVPDFSVLTEEEKRVVHASIYPLRGGLETLRENDVTIHILPLDVRPTDLEYFAELSGETSEDHRSYEAATGLAEHQRAIAKIEELLNVTEQNGWVFAHEFAHLIYFYLPDVWQQVIEQLYADAMAAHYTFGAYQLSNVDEFFVGAYVDFLLWHYELAGHEQMDDLGIREDIYDIFEQLSQLDSFTSKAALREAKAWLS